MYRGSRNTKSFKPRGAPLSMWPSRLHGNRQPHVSAPAQIPQVDRAGQNFCGEKIFHETGCGEKTHSKGQQQEPLHHASKLVKERT